MLSQFQRSLLDDVFWIIAAGGLWDADGLYEEAQMRAGIHSPARLASEDRAQWIAGVDAVPHIGRMQNNQPKGGEIWVVRS